MIGANMMPELGILQRKHAWASKKLKLEKVQLLKKEIQ